MDIEEIKRRLRVNAVKVIRLEDEEVGEPAGKRTPPPLKDKYAKEVAKSHAVKLDMFNKSNLLSGFQTALENNFDQDDDLANRAHSSLSLLHSQIRNKLREEGNKSANRAGNAISDGAMDIVNTIERTFNRRLSTKAVAAFEDGIYDGRVANVVFIMFKNVEDTDGNIEPLKIVTVTELHPNSVYLNPSMTRVSPVGTFRLGYLLKGTLEQQKKEAVAHVQEQFIADSYLMSALPRNVPQGADSAHFARYKEIAKADISTNEIDLTLRKMPVASVREFANSVYVWLYSLIKASDPSFRDRIIYTIRNESGVNHIIFKFARADKSQGDTLHSGDIKHLSMRFTPEEITLIMHALSSR